MAINASFSRSHSPAGEDALQLTKEDIVAVVSDTWPVMVLALSGREDKSVLTSSGLSETWG